MSHLGLSKIYLSVLAGLSMLVMSPSAIAQVEKREVSHPDNSSVNIVYHINKPKKKKSSPPVFILIRGQKGYNNGEDYPTKGMFKFLPKKGFMTVAVSLPGHGSSGGETDYYGPFARKAVEAVIDDVKLISNGPVFVQGFSRGAMLAAMLATERSDLAGVILISGPYDLKSLYDKNPNSRFAKNLKKELKENPVSQKSLKERSPLLSSSDISTPVLIIHGDDDSQAPVSQAEAMNKKINDSGGTSEIRILQAGHNINFRLRKSQTMKFLNGLL